MLEILLSRAALKLAAATVVFCGVWYGVTSYNSWVSAEAVAEVEARYTVKFNDITEQAQQLKRAIDANAAASRLAIANATAKEQEKANAANKRYQAELAKNKTLASQLAAARNTELVGSLLDSTRPISDRGRSECPSISQYSNDLATRYASCEQDLEIAIGEAAKAVDRAATAEAGVRALNKEE